MAVCRQRHIRAGFWFGERVRFTFIDRKFLSAYVYVLTYVIYLPGYLCTYI